MQNTNWVHDITSCVRVESDTIFGQPKYGIMKVILQFHIVPGLGSKATTSMSRNHNTPAKRLYIRNIVANWVCDIASGNMHE